MMGRIYQISFVFILLIHSFNSFSMTMRQKKINEIRLYGRLNNTSKLLLEDAPFHYAQLLDDLQIRIAAFTTPYSFKKLSITCKFLYENLSLQHPKIWNVICHSLNCIKQENMPKILLMAHMCQKSEIKNKIADQYTYAGSKYPYKYICHTYDSHNLTNDKRKEILFFPFKDDNAEHTVSMKQQRAQTRGFPIIVEEKETTPFLCASYIGDINLFKEIVTNNAILPDNEIDHALYAAMYNQNLAIIPLLCELSNGSKYPLSATDRKLFCDVAFSFQKIKVFEVLIMCCQNYLNLPDERGRTYLDSLICRYGGDNPTSWQSNYYNVVRKFGSIGSKVQYSVGFIRNYIVL